MERPAQTQPSPPASALKCFVVYSDVTHCPRINDWLELARPVVTEASYEWFTLTDTIRSSEDYLTKLDEMLSECALGLVFLDGLRPNVTYELGVLCGLDKPVILLKSREARFCVKTLYPRDPAHPNECALQARTAGLSNSRQFERMADPPLNLKEHFSDFGGTHVAEFDPGAPDNSPARLAQVLRTELEKAGPEVAEKAASSVSRGLRGTITPEEVEAAARLMQQATRQTIGDPARVNIDELDKLLSGILRLGKVPPAILLRAVAGAAFRRLDAPASDVERRRALTLAEKALREMTQSARTHFDSATALTGLGYTLSQLGRREEEIRVYDEVVKRFGKAKETPLLEQVAMALVNKGVTLGQLGRRKEAIKVYDQVVKRFGKARETPLLEGVARALVNKGLTLGQLGRRKEAIRVCDEVVRRFGTAKETPLLVWVVNALFYKACALARLGQADKAFVALEQALARGFPVVEAEENPDLLPLHSDPRWKALLDRFRNPPPQP